MNAVWPTLKNWTWPSVMFHWLHLNSVSTRCYLSNYYPCGAYTKHILCWVKLRTERGCSARGPFWAQDPGVLHFLSKPLISFHWLVWGYVLEAMCMSKLILSRSFHCYHWSVPHGFVYPPQRDLEYLWTIWKCLREATITGQKITSTLNIEVKLCRLHKSLLRLCKNYTTTADKM